MPRPFVPCAKELYIPPKFLPKTLVCLLTPSLIHPVAFFNILACVGWSAINVIVGAQLLHTVNNHLPGWAAIILIATATFLVALFGYKVVHGYEFYSWIPSFIIFLIVLVEFARSGHFLNVPMRAGSSEAGSVLSFAASVFGFATGWTSYAADYTVYQPVTSSRRKVFAWTFAGLLAPLCFTEMLGLAVSTAVMNVDVAPQYAAGFRDSGIGGLLGAVLLPPLGRFGEFCLVVLALSIVANNCPNIYSLALSLQVMDRHVEAVPRFIWTFIGTLVYCAIAIPGYGRFTDVLENFMLLIVRFFFFFLFSFSPSPFPFLFFSPPPPFFPYLYNQTKPDSPTPPPQKQSYWLAIYESICLTDHFLFKRGFGGYDLTIYRDPSRLPVGVAALVAFGLGVGGAVLGMAQQWFVGPVGKMVGDSGGDVGFLLAFGFAGVGYVGLRGVERRVLGR